ncbi:MAG: hypothetical protein ABI374_11135 [Ginsengibacter sp.]
MKKRQNIGLDFIADKNLLTLEKSCKTLKQKMLNVKNVPCD